MNTPTLFDAPQTHATSDDYYTPAWVFERLGLAFALDVAAPPGGAPAVPAEDYYTLADDGLVQPWHGRVWMNPPWSSPAAWARRWLDHGHGVALLPHSKSRWHLDVWAGADAIALPDGGYWRFDGPRNGDPFMPWFIAAAGAECVAAIARLGAVRVRRP